MAKKTTKTVTVSLSGDWSISGISDQYPVLNHSLANLLQSPGQKNSPANPELDLAKVTALDACGCQLLAHFYRTLQKDGISIRIRNIPEAYRDKIRLLGFARDLNLPH